MKPSGALAALMRFASAATRLSRHLTLACALSVRVCRVFVLGRKMRVAKAWVSSFIIDATDLHVRHTDAPTRVAARGIMLTACSDVRPPRSIVCTPLAKATSGFGSAGSNRFSHGTVLCPGLRALQAASCSTLGDAGALATLLTPIANEPLCCKVGWAGVQQSAEEMAHLLIGFANTLRVPRSDPLRYVATHSGNGWLSLVIAVYLQRVHGGLLHGLLVAEGKSEWMHAGDVRLLLRQAGLSYRAADKFEPLPELALLTADPRPNRLIGSIPWTAARALLPPQFEGSATPFGACLRIGSGANDAVKVLEDVGLLAPYCRAFAFYSANVPASMEESSRSRVVEAWRARLRTPAIAGYERSGDIQEAASSQEASAAAAVTRESARVHRAGNWTILSARPPDRLHFKNCRMVGRDCARPEFEFEQKEQATPLTGRMLNSSARQ